MKTTINALVAAACILLSTACATVPEDPTEFETATFYGMVYNGQNEGVSSARVSIDGEQVAMTDINGRFFIPGMKRGSYEIVIQKEEYETKRLRFDFLNKGNILYVNMMSAQDYMQQLDSYLAQGNFAKAHEAMLKGLEIAPENPALRYLAALYYIRTENLEPAFDLLSELIQEYPYDPPLYLAILDIAIINPEYSRGARAIIQTEPAIVHNERIKNRLERLPEEATQ
jgi:hypothetical protein